MEPLANQIRPLSLDEYVGQTHLVGPGKPLRLAIEQGHIFSFVLWGTPGTGKTTLARIYANAINADFYELSAVSAGKEDIRKIVSGRSAGVLPASKTTDNLPLVGDDKEDSQAGSLRSGGRPRVLFLDEIHRFNKAQQDFLLPFVENGELVLIGATTENPSFEIIPALLSRLRVFVLNEFTEADMAAIIDRTGFELGPEAKQWLIEMANGDARQAITMIENTSRLYDSITLETLKETLQSKFLRYDKKGEEHYNIISAFIKSMRASKPDAAMYYLARMLESGEDPKFIARRMVIFASEDIGLAQPTALVVANAVFQAVTTIGMPECIHNLAHGVGFLANAAKDRSATNAIGEAMEDAKKLGNLPVPMKIRNAPTKLMKDLGYGKDEGNDPDGDLMPETLRGRKYF
ncbi:MAG TPA: replication-associated recombination protein A [Pyrinomonadaceae bacterium]|nr:replication-associated recombination protein A [Acidobacteriota bacterium]HQZ94887.1 replication-associated recombination protein A [Pyrinomonadaceae bacterium]